MDEKLLKGNGKTFLKSAEMLYNNWDFTSSTILYFKALFSILDLIILKSLGKIPKDHTERFRILKKLKPSLYSILDKIYPTYRNTYTSKINKETCQRIKQDVERIIEKERIF